MSTSVSKSVYVDVDIDIELSDVCDFIDDCSKDDLKFIAEKLSEQDIECQVLTQFDPSTIRHLIERANIFGLDDMLDDLKREGARIGAFLNVECK